MPWSKPVTEQFSLVDRFTAQENNYYGPFNTLLFELFPPSENYQVAPQYGSGYGSHDTACYVVHKRQVPIFFVQLKMYDSLKNLATRALTHNQMRGHFREFLPGPIPMPKLFGVSFFGTQFCVYALTTETRIFEPNITIEDPHIANDVAPETRWAFDILNDEGEVKLREVVTEVKAMAADL